jgi:hypothetical protein
MKDYYKILAFGNYLISGGHTAPWMIDAPRKFMLMTLAPVDLSCNYFWASEASAGTGCNSACLSRAFSAGKLSELIFLK